jgi:ribosomal protein L31E
MNPIKFAQMMRYLTRAKNVDPNLPKVTTADKIPIPPKKQTVEEMEAVNEFMRRNPRVEKAGGGMLVKPSADGSRPEYGRPSPISEKKKAANIKAWEKNTGLNFEEFSKTANSEAKSAIKLGKIKGTMETRDKGSKLNKVREYLRKVLKRKDSVTFNNISDLIIKSGLKKTDTKISADVSRLINTDEFKNVVKTVGQEEKTKYGNNAERFRNILRDMQKTIPEGKKQFINMAYVAKKYNLPGDANSGSYSRVLQEPEFNNFVVLKGDVKSNPQIIRFAEEFENLYEIKDVDKNFFKELAVIIYGNDKPDSIKKVTADASKYAEFLYGVRDVTDADGNKLKLPSVEKRGDYLFELLDETLALEEGEKGKVRPIKFGSGIERDRMLAIRDGLLGFTEGQTQSQRLNIIKLLKKGYQLDEVAGIAATHEIAPGYTELAQGLKKKINADKLVEIDKPFSRIFNQLVMGEKPRKGYQYKGKFYQNIEDVVRLYNKDADKYGKKYNIDVPLIEYDRGKPLKPENFLTNFKYLSPEAQANVKELADKGFGVRTGAFTMGQLEDINLTTDKKTQAEILRKMGFKCKYAKADGGRINLSTGSGRCDDPASYVDDINKTRQDLKSTDVRVQAAANAKLNKGLEIAKKLPTIGRFLVRVGQATVGGVSKALQATGVGTPVGIALEGMVEGAIYDYYKGKGYNHKQALSETFFPGMFSGRPEGVPWYGGAEQLLEQELIKDKPKVAQYVSALKDRDQVFDAFRRKELALARGRKDQLDEATADIRDLTKTGTIKNINELMNPNMKFDSESPLVAYEEAVAAQAAKKAAAAKEYKDKFYMNRDPSDFTINKQLDERNKQMLEMFPPPTVDTVRDAYTAAGYGDALKTFTAEDYKDQIKAFDDYQKQSYFADNFRLEKAGGGIAGLSGGIDEGPQRRSMNPDSGGLKGLLNRGIKG